MREEHIKSLKSICTKLTNPDPEFSKEEIELFMNSYLAEWILRDAMIYAGCAELVDDIKQIIDKNEEEDLSADDITVILNYLSGKNHLNNDEYYDLFHWFYFDRKKHHFDVPMQIWSENQESVINYHSYTLTKRKQRDLWNKILNWD